MSFERPSKGLLVFQCDVCFETFELSKDDHDLQDFRSCWAIMHEEGWSLRTTRPGNEGGHNSLSKSMEHLCPDCSKTARDDRANPFRR